MKAVTQRGIKLGDTVSDLHHPDNEYYSGPGALANEPDACYSYGTEAYVPTDGSPAPEHQQLVASIDRLVRASNCFCISGILTGSGVKEACQHKQLGVLLQEPEKEKEKDRWERAAWGSMEKHYSWVCTIDELLDAKKRAELAQACRPAPYGDPKIGATVLDPAVRLATEGDFAVRDGESEYMDEDEYEALSNIPGLDEITKQIMTSLYRGGESIFLQTYRINIYGPGGFFKPHMDTPTEPESFLGSVVVCLPSPHKGGELRVRHGGQEQLIDFAARSGEAGLLQWAAFYGDCEHEVLPVREGHRVTLTYGIHRTGAHRDVALERYSSDVAADAEAGEEQGGVPSEDGYEKVDGSKSKAGPMDPEELEAAKSDLLDAVRQLETPHKYIGFLLSHRYTRGGLTHDGLKGSDKVLYEALEELQSPVHFQPVLFRSFTEMNSEETYIHAKEVYSLKLEDIKHLTGRGPRPKYDFEDNTLFFWVACRGEELWLQRGVGGDTGNEYRPAEKDGLYLQAALIVEKPMAPEDT